MNWDLICFNASAFAAGLFLLEFGADRFIDHTAIIAHRLGVSQTLVALLTAGAEWEELAVVVASILQNRSSLALGNVIGSSISNILGAFSLGLLFHAGPMAFDRSAKIYATLLFLVTTIFVVVALTASVGRVAGAIFIAAFGMYIVSIGYGIYKGVLDAPEDSDDDDSDSGRSSDYDDDDGEHAARSPKHSLSYHILQLILGFIALSLSGYVLSHSAASLADEFDLSGTVLGVTVLSFATTLPEKFVAVMSGARGHGGIVVASTAGSNIFLLTLCLGITLVAGNQKEIAGAAIPFELLVTWVASALFVMIVFMGSRRWVGGVLMVFYILFIVLEFTLYRR
ncbi:Sodium calcium exchanger membrane region [Pyrenophora seminiperda CCB06]|uniref:Sodium calcium exchanger membrane region n=1 Tax=Pyrenophora seminiperda CCB06 TaxID=1302712 RepID=A0A3M7MF84_9PLEO|nr:Sodium calcium exchanger membrane region [Pyrenophora seminiperda CCB06]